MLLKTKCLFCQYLYHHKIVSFTVYLFCMKSMLSFGKICISSAPRKKKKKNLCIKLGTISWRYACYLRRALLYVLEAQAFTLLWRNALILPWIHLLTKTLFFFFQSHCSNNNATCISEVVFFIIWIEKQLPLNITSI